MALYNNVKNFLKSKHIVVPDEWIPPCVQWIQSDNPGINMNNTRVVFEKVYEQWLHADLTELASCCLPFGLVQKKSTTLSGHFVLQVNQVRDIGNPAYSQLQKLRKTDNANASVTAERQFQSAWEPKPSRMLMMQMTDGTSVVQGMEYRFIPHLNVNLKPGSKVLVSGTVNARRGVLLLTKDIITLLGGGTDSLAVTNAMENVIARALGVEETEEPNVLEEMEATQVPPSQASQYYPSQINRQPPQSQSSQVGRNCRTGMPPPSNNISQSFPIPRASPSLDDLGDDDFVDDDLEAALNLFESQGDPSVPNRSNTSGNFGSTNSTRTQNISGSFGGTNNSRTQNFSENVDGTNVRPQNLSNTQRRVPAISQPSQSQQDMDSEMDIGDEFFNDDFDDDLVSAESSLSQDSILAFCQGKNSANPPKINNPLRNPMNPPKSFVNISKNTFNSLPVQPLSQKPNNNVSRPLNQPSSFSKQNELSNTKNFMPVKPLSSQKSSKPNTSLLSTKTSKLQANQSRLTSFLTKTPPCQNETKNPDYSNPHSSSNDGQFDCFDLGLSFDEDVREPKRRKTSVSIPSVTEQVKEGPFTYLSLIPESSTQTQEFVVKGFIMTLISKLDITTDGNWKLTTVINDGSAARDVDIDNSILCRLIGMTSAQFLDMKREARLNPSNANLHMQLNKRVSGCQQKLISLCSLLKLRISPDYTRPKLVEINPVTSMTSSQLIQRSSNL